MVAPSRAYPQRTPGVTCQIRSSVASCTDGQVFAHIAETQARSASADKLRAVAPREVQRSRVATDDKAKFFIPASWIFSDFASTTFSMSLIGSHSPPRKTRHLSPFATSSASRATAFASSVPTETSPARSLGLR
ncbi:hypothetical protein DD237_007529 [Peronospora effusa]|uniref:Uncharacterized protein n=1 Tax=Peronospora effusa TaxID=542832 RepID=A0A3R7W8P7_9STRA|nr:hypothetical protein DD237_007529 [Peronospora effusa]